MANFSFSSSAKLFSDEEDANDSGSDIEIVESEFCFEESEEKGNAFLNESIGQQSTQQQSSLQDISSDRDFLLLMEQNENALTNSFGSFGFDENAPKILPIVGKDAGIQTQFPEPLENVENGADNDEEKEEKQKQSNEKMEKKSPIKIFSYYLNSQFHTQALSKLVAGFDYSNGKLMVCGWLDPETNVVNCISSHCQNDSLDVAESKALATSVKEICTQIENLLKMKNERIGHGIFAIPDHWNIGQRREFMGALKSMAGFEKIHLLNGQSAVALGFCRQKHLTKMTKNGLLLWIIKSTPRSMEMCMAQIRQNKLIILARNELNAFGFDFDADKLALATFRQHFEANIADCHSILLMGNFQIEKLESTIQEKFGIKQTQIHSIGLDASSLCVNGCLYYAENFDVQNKNSPIQIVELLSRPIYCHYLEANTQTMIFPKFSQYPCKKKINFYSVIEAQQTFQIKFYEMDEKYAIAKLDKFPVEDGHNLLHNISISLLNNDFHTFGKIFLRLCLEIDANGIFHVRIEKSGRHTSLDE